MKTSALFILIIVVASCFGQGNFPPEVGMKGTTAIHKDSSAFKDWASECFVIRGKQNILKLNSDTAFIGRAINATGKADGNDIISLGDGGEATLQFSSPIYDGAGPDFAVFENAFNSTFLELAFVEVSSDGTNFFRFASESLTDTLSPVGSFGSIDAANIHNLAGKYQANYGTPFDLNELDGIQGLDVQNITHIKIIDVVGSLDSTIARRDSKGRKINDQFPTEFPSGGFDLDAVGAIHIKTTGIRENYLSDIQVFPNPAMNYIQIENNTDFFEFEIFNVSGQFIEQGELSNSSIEISELESGMYQLRLFGTDKVAVTKFLKR